VNIVPVPPEHPVNEIPFVPVKVTKVALTTAPPVDIVPIPPVQPVNVVPPPPPAVYVTTWAPKLVVTNKVPEAGNPVVEATLIVP
jgi:hypothetical protein